MPGKILAALLLLFGGGVTLYIIYRASLAVLQPVVQKKLAQKMQREKYEQLENNLQLHKQADHKFTEAAGKNPKK